MVCDRLTIRIHTQFNGHPSETHHVRVEDLAQPDKQALLRRLWLEPESFRPRQTNRSITEAAAKSFALLAEQLRGRGHGADDVAHFLTQCLFCFFAEDVGLLPGRMFERLVNNRQLVSAQLTQGLSQLFSTMQTGGLYGPDSIPWFNGGLFAQIGVPKLEILDITELRNAASLNWSAIDVSIFGTLFERGLDPAKRSQLGAHYTDPATIARIIDPVITRPLLEEWELAAQDLQVLTAKIKKHGDASYRRAHNRFVQWLERLRAFRILDPACGSGNFLFLGLKALKDVELYAITQAANLGLAREQDLVTGPHNMLGIELNEYAAELARVSLWIGEIQWRIAHGYEVKTNPVLEPLEQIECRDALLRVFLPLPQGGEGATATEAPWPRADVVVGNPPFLGGSKKRRELGADYFDALNHVYGQQVPGAADLVCYWFAKSLAYIAAQHLNAAGFVSTNSIRGGANRRVLDAIVEHSQIFDAWSDETWVNEGAAVRVSLVCFGAGSGTQLNGEEVHSILSDLTAVLGEGLAIDLSSAKSQPGNGTSAFEGLRKDGPLDISGQQARSWLAMPNPHGRNNAEVLFPLINGMDITRRTRDGWVIDTGESMAEQDAALYEAPFEHILRYVKPIREQNNDRIRRTFWWRFGRNGEQLRAALKPLARYINTPRVAKHRLFVWQHMPSIPDTATVAIARADDTTFGILHSRFHELWSLRMGTWLGVGNDPRYTPTTCFETFPFPPGLTPQDTEHQRTETLEGGALIPAGLPTAPANIKQKTASAYTGQAPAATNPIAPHAAASAIAQAAQRLDQLRRNWLNPPEWTRAVAEVVPLGLAASPYPDRIEPRPGLNEQDAKALQGRTLTKLYNQRPAWLNAAHAQLDAAVAAAYGWADWRADMADDEILRRLLRLNHERHPSKARP